MRVRRTAPLPAEVIAEAELGRVAGRFGQRLGQVVDRFQEE